MKKAIFLTHRNTLGYDNTITGGVQLCSQEFYELIVLLGFDLQPYYVGYTKRYIHRILIKLKWDSYLAYDTKSDQSRLLEFISKNNITTVFINHSSLLRYSRLLQNKLKNAIEIILLSHGNDSGDFLHLVTKPIKNQTIYSRIRDKYRLGNLMFTESISKQKYIDTVFVVSEIEKNIEYWTGAKKVHFIPRSINKEIRCKLSPESNKAGFIGRLDHPPNLLGLDMICREIQKQIVSDSNFELALIGGPVKYGNIFKTKYPFIKYKGELEDSELIDEVVTWSIFLNPVFWYSMGVSTKLAKAIEWGLPTITSNYGLRGYRFTKGKIMIADSPQEMVELLLEIVGNKEKIVQAIDEMKLVKSSSSTLVELSQMLKNEISG